MKVYDFSGIFKRLISVGLAARDRVGNHAKGKMRSPFWKKRRKIRQRMAKTSRKRSRPRHSRRRRVVGKGKSAHSSRSW